MDLLGPEVVSALASPGIILGTVFYLVLKPILKQSGLIDETKGAYKRSMIAYNVLMAVYSATAFLMTWVALGWDRGYGQWLRDLTGDKVVTLYQVRRPAVPVSQEAPFARRPALPNRVCCCPASIPRRTTARLPSSRANFSCGPPGPSTTPSTSSTSIRPGSCSRASLSRSSRPSTTLARRGTCTSASCCRCPLLPARLHALIRPGGTSLTPCPSRIGAAAVRRAP